MRPLVSIRTVAMLSLLTTLPLSGLAHAEGERRQQRARAPEAGTPVKDCTRLNGRYGYYANPWCDAAEQNRFDRWDAARLRRR